MTGKRVAPVLEQLKGAHGLPSVIHCDSGTEFISRAVDDWVHRNGVKLDSSRPARPTDTTFIESFNGKLRNGKLRNGKLRNGKLRNGKLRNGKLREEYLKQHWFRSIQDAKNVIEEWQKSILSSGHIALCKGKYRKSLKGDGDETQPLK